MDLVRIGCGAGFSGDRLPPALDLLARGDLDYLVLECLSERTIAEAQSRRLADPNAGYDLLLDKRMRQMLPLLEGRPTRLITNMGAANPEGAARATAKSASELGVDIDIATLTGDDVIGLIDPSAPAMEDGVPLEAHGEIISANAYLGIEHILPALGTGAQVVITGRVADPSLFLGPLTFAHGWDPHDFDVMARGTVVGHLLECGPQVTGGYFADPPYRVVPDLADIGYPLAEVAADGSAIVTKLERTGGLVSVDTVVEQLFYELTDPCAYVTPDVVADFSHVKLIGRGNDRVLVDGGRGGPKPAMLKVSVGYRSGFGCEGEISYVGRGALERARLACDVIRRRLPGDIDLHLEINGVDAGRSDVPASRHCRVRVACLVSDEETADAVAEEVVALYTSGPAGGGGVRTRVHGAIGMASTAIPREAVATEVGILRSGVAT